MTSNQFVRLLRKELSDWKVIESVKEAVYSGGGSLHLVLNDGKKIRILIDEE